MPAANLRMRGFSLVELSVVLVVIAVIVGAVATASDLMRQAAGQRIFTDFVSPWKSAFIAFTTRRNLVPGDDSKKPTGFIKGSRGSELCNTDANPELTNIMLNEGIEVPTGRGIGKEDKYVYLDSNGSPNQLEICLVTIRWSVPGSSVNDVKQVDRHVIHFRGMTVELALQLDSLIDGNSDARFGKFRSPDWAASPGVDKDGVRWPKVRTEAGEDDLKEVEAYLLLN